MCVCVIIKGAVVNGIMNALDILFLTADLVDYALLLSKHMNIGLITLKSINWLIISTYSCQNTQLMVEVLLPDVIQTSCLLQWQAITITLVEKVQIVAVFLGSLFLVASISWLLWSALSLQAAWQRRDILFQICYAMYAFMDLVCIGED